jgi:anti-sigma B factor antagonist
VTADTPLKLDVEVRPGDGGGIARVAASGEIDLATADDLAAVLSEPECAEAGGIVLDLSRVSFMDSSGLRVLLILAEERGNRLATVLAEGSAVMRLLELVEVKERLGVKPSLEEAYAAVGEHADSR